MNHGPEEADSEVIKRIGVAIVEWDGCVLVGIRQSDQVLAGYHEFPGGKCHPGENSEDCAVRECEEETGLRVEPVEALHVETHSYEHGTVEVSFVRCVPSQVWGELPSPFFWVRKDELHNLKFPEANHNVLAMLRN